MIAADRRRRPVRAPAPRLLTLFVVLGFLAPLGTAWAADPSPAAATQRPNTTAPSNTALVQPPTRQISLEAHKGTLIRLSQPAATVFVADPAIADVQVKSPQLIYLYAKAAGQTTLYAVDNDNNVLLSSTVTVAQDLEALRTALNQVLPETPIDVTAVGDGIMLSGNVANAADAKTAMSLAQRIVAKDAIIDHLKVDGPDQVNLRVRVAEVSRTVIKDLGFNWTGSFSAGNVRGGAQLFNGGTTFVNPGNTPLPLVSGFAFPPALGPESLGLAGHNFSSFLDALANNGLAKVLAEPNLTALSGHEASFLAGGEFPIPVPQSGGTGSSVAITIDFKKFGVQLDFTPTILSGNRISLHVAPQVSELSSSGSITLQGFTIPAITTRQAQTTVELASGQSFAIAGLLQNNTNENVAKFPGLGDLPVLGALFRSHSFQRNESELVVIVTPYVVRPTSKPLMSPTDGLVAPNDIERIFSGINYRREKPGFGFPQPAGVPSGLEGSVGYQLE